MNGHCARATTVSITAFNWRAPCGVCAQHLTSFRIRERLFG